MATKLAAGRTRHAEFLRDEVMHGNDDSLGKDCMSSIATPLPCRQPDLIFSPAGEGGGYVIKDSRGGNYFTIGEQEHFLLTQFDGEQSAEVIRARFAERFGQPLEPEELDEFL